VSSSTNVHPCVYWTAEIYDPLGGACDGMRLSMDTDVLNGQHKAHWTKNTELASNKPYQRLQFSTQNKWFDDVIEANQVLSL